MKDFLISICTSINDFMCHGITNSPSVVMKEDAMGDPIRGVEVPNLLVLYVSSNNS